MLFEAIPQTGVLEKNAHLTPTKHKKFICFTEYTIDHQLK